MTYYKTPIYATVCHAYETESSVFFSRQTECTAERPGAATCDCISGADDAAETKLSLFPTLMPLVGCWLLYCPQLKSYSLSQPRYLRSARLNYGHGTIGAIDASRRDPRSGRTSSSLQSPPVDRLAERDPNILMTSVFLCVRPY